VYVEIHDSVHLVDMEPEVVRLDETGRVICDDTRAERIAEQTDMLSLFLGKMPQAPALRSMLQSYSHSIDDPDNEFVHLYEIRDALSKHFGDDKAARAALGIASDEWRRVGCLANKAPVTQGRHRGKKYDGLRSATPGELAEMREIVKRWIIAFANSV